jgi:hypothetical protein
MNQIQKRQTIFLALVIGMIVGIIRVGLAYQLRPLLGNGAGDFSFATLIARDVLRGDDPYRYEFGHDSVPYPLPAGLLALPFTVFSDEVASGIFLGLSSFLLAWCLMTNERPWALVLFLSLPFFYAVLFAQWTPLMLCLWFVPALAPLVLVKPNIALPMILTGKVNRTGVILTGVLLVVSFLIYPNWLFVWLQETRTYRGTPPLLSLPLGPIVLLALLKFRDRRAWLLMLLALMPQRVLYDQLPLLLVATNLTELIFLILCSWMILPALFAYGGWAGMPINWQFWIVLTHYLPVLIVLFAPEVARWLKRSMPTKSYPR